MYICVYNGRQVRFCPARFSLPHFDKKKKMNKDRFSTFRKKLRELHIKNNIHLPGEQKRYLEITIITAKTTKNKTTCVYSAKSQKGEVTL